MSTTGCCRGLSAKDCIARPYGCGDAPYTACPDCGSVQPYQHMPDCKLAVMKDKKNLQSRYKDEFLRGWQGCSHLDCPPECSEGYCQRLADALARWEDGL